MQDNKKLKYLIKLMKKQNRINESKKEDEQQNEGRR